MLLMLCNDISISEDLFSLLEEFNSRGSLVDEDVLESLNDVKLSGSLNGGLFVVLFLNITPDVLDSEGFSLVFKSELKDKNKFSTVWSSRDLVAPWMTSL